MKKLLYQDIKYLGKIMSLLLMLFLIGGGYADHAFSQSPERRGLQIEIETRGDGSVTITTSDGENIPLYGESYALIIGVSEYTNGWPSLPGVKKDVAAVKTALEKQGFQVVLVEDPTFVEMEQAFRDFINRYGQDPENRLLFYFSGHGHTAPLAYGAEMGYIVPVDAPNPYQDETGFTTTAMDMQMIEVYAKRIQSKHALFLFDSCFSGSIFSLSRAVPENISYKTTQPVRQFLTSGSAEEQVPDESIFRQQFIAALKGEGDVNGDGYVTGAELGEFLQNKVVNYSKGAQHPQYGKIRDPYLDKGDFVFVIPLEEQEPQTPEVASPADVDVSFLNDLKLKAAWQEGLNKMEQAFADITSYEEQQLLSKELAVEAWKRFLEAFSEDNPYSERDNELLGLADERLAYWNSYTEAFPTPSPSSDPSPTPFVELQPTPLLELDFSVKDIVIEDEQGNVISPENDIYYIPQGATVTITVNIEGSENQRVQVAWTTGRGKVPPSLSHTNTYTATTLGSDYIKVVVWDTLTGKELPEIPINITVIPPEMADVSFRIAGVLMQDANGNMILPEDDIYTVKQGATVTIVLDVMNPKGYNVKFAWTTGRGKVPISETATNLYTATSVGGDYVVVYTWNPETGQEFPEFPISISVVP